MALANALTFDDVLIKPRYSDKLPSDVDLRTQLTPEICLSVPLLSSAMDTVSEHRLAIALAEEGGLGVLHKNMNIKFQAKEVTRVKKFESGIVDDPITVSPDSTLADVLALAKRYRITGMPVVESGSVVGIITHRDYRFAEQADQPVRELMTPRARLITLDEQAGREQAMALFHQHRIEKLVIVNKDFGLCGLMTVKDVCKSQLKPHACKDSSGSLRVAAAVGTDASTPERMTALVEAGVDVLVDFNRTL